MYTIKMKIKLNNNRLVVKGNHHKLNLKEISEFYFKGERIHLGAEANGIAGEFPTHYFREWLNGLNGQSNEFMDLLKSAYSKYERNADAMRYWVNAVFGDDGLICIDANSAELKELARPLFEKELQIPSP